ncbi:MAG: peptidase [Hydrogenophilales bacterium]|nr:peptidase [Hydrogenophilales bacterium]
MAGNIDYKFISDLEGGSKTSGYVPAADVSKSGVTIATGFDLGQRGEADLKALGFSDDLIAKLKPFLGKTGKEAQQALEKSTLTVTPEQASEIDKAVKTKHVEQITLKYDTVAKNSKKFFELPAEAQTAIASVSFQYGANLATATPKFWEAAIAQDWKECTKLLKNFGDAYPTRRKKEAALLEAIK